MKNLQAFLHIVFPSRDGFFARITICVERWSIAPALKINPVDLFMLEMESQPPLSASAAGPLQCPPMISISAEWTARRKDQSAVSIAGQCTYSHYIY